MTSNPVIRHDTYLVGAPARRIRATFPVQAIGLDGILNINFPGAADSTFDLFPEGFILVQSFVLADFPPMQIDSMRIWTEPDKSAKAQYIIRQQTDYLDAARILIDSTRPNSQVKMSLLDQIPVLTAVGFIDSISFESFVGTDLPDYFRFDPNSGTFSRTAVRFSTAQFVTETAPVLMRFDDINLLDSIFAALLSTQEIKL